MLHVFLTEKLEIEYLLSFPLWNQFAILQWPFQIVTEVC